MGDVQRLRQGFPGRRQVNSLPCSRLRIICVPGEYFAALFAILALAGLALGQSQTASPAQPSQPQMSSQQVQPSSPQGQPALSVQAAPQQQSQQPVKPKRIPAPTVAEAARNAKAKVDASDPQKVYTDADIANLPPGGITIAGPLAQPASAAKPVDTTAQQAAYWKVRFTTARQTLAQDKKALPVLQSQLGTERVQEYIGDPDSGQLYSDTHMDLVHQIDALKATIEQDKKALSDLHEEFRRAGGQPGWIR